MAGNGRAARFAGVLVLTMASLRLDVFPSVRLKCLNEISDLHLTSILPYTGGEVSELHFVLLSFSSRGIDTRCRLTALWS